MRRSERERQRETSVFVEGESPLGMNKCNYDQREKASGGFILSAVGIGITSVKLALCSSMYAHSHDDY